MSLERRTPPDRDRNYEIGARREVCVGAESKYTVPAARFLRTPAENSLEYGLEVPSYLKLIIEKPCEHRDESALLVFEIDSQAPEITPDTDSIYMLPQDCLMSEVGVGLSADELKSIAQSIPADGTQISRPHKLFSVESNEQGDVIVTGCSETGTLLVVPGPPAG
jgi:hypothetical protein